MIETKAIQKIIPFYVEREGQKAIFEVVETCLKDEYKKHIILIQAGTGSGKTFGYLFPMFEYMFDNKEIIMPPILLSTHSLILQNQIFYKDIETVNKIVSIDKETEIFENISMRKGRGIYLCKKKLINPTGEKKALQGEHNKIYDILHEEILEEKNKIKKAKVNILKNGESLSNFYNFDKAKMHEFEELKRIANLEISFETCNELNCRVPNKFCSNCAFDCVFKSSLYEKNTIKIINHALLFSTFAKITEISSKLSKISNNEGYSKHKNSILIFDEAHHIPNIMQSLNNSIISIYFIRNLLKKISNGNDVHSNLGVIDKIKETSYEIRSKLVDICITCNRLIDIFLNQNRKIFTENHINVEFITNPGEQLLDITGMLKPMAEFILNIKYEFIKLEELIKNIICEDKLKDFIELLDVDIQKCLQLFFSFENGINISDICRMIYRFKSTNELKDNYEFIYNNLHIDKNKLTEHFGHTKVMIFLSATLSTKNNFDFFKSQSGFSNEYFEEFEFHELQIGSPFDFKSNMDAYLSINQENNKPYKEILYTINNIKGGSLLLFTSYSQVNIFYKDLHKSITNKKVFMQTKENKNIIMDYISKNDDAVIFATLSFWEGIDLPGNKLEFLYIDKLPFSNINDIIFKRNSLIMQEKELDPFMDYAVNNAILTFKQGIGRLLRHENDKGILFINDSRIFNSKKYGEFFLNEIPTNVKKVKNYIEYINQIKENSLLNKK